MEPYIKRIRKMVGYQPIILNSASGALLNDQNQVLLQERTDTGNWGFPGGYLEYGETYAKAAVREFKEDAGLLVEPVKLLQISDDFQYEYPNGDQLQPINCFYLVRYVSGHLLTEKTNETVSLSYFDLTNPPTFFNGQHAGMFRALKQFVDQQSGRMTEN